jgi:hypothetical protein
LKCLTRENKTSSAEEMVEEQPVDDTEHQDPSETLREEKSWNIAANLAAVFLAVACVFLHAYFA